MFRCEFSNFLRCALDVKWSLENTMRLMAAIKGRGMMGSVVTLVTHAFPGENDN